MGTLEKKCQKLWKSHEKWKYTQMIILVFYECSQYSWWCSGAHTTGLLCWLGSKRSWNFLLLSWKSHEILRIRRRKSPVLDLKILGKLVFFFKFKKNFLLFFVLQDIEQAIHHFRINRSLAGWAHSQRRVGVNITIPLHWLSCEWTLTLPIFLVFVRYRQ